MRVAICCSGATSDELLRDALTLGSALAARGHSVQFAVGDPLALVALAGSWIPSDIYQAPQVMPPPQLVMKRAPVDGLADSMAIAGFDEKQTLLTLSAVWRDLLLLLRPDVIVAFGSSVAWLIGPTVAPTLAIGPGMALPPALGSSFPRLSAESVELADETLMLANANAALARLGQPSLATLSEVMTNCSTLLYGLPIFDPYLQLRRDVTTGVLGTMPLPTLPPPGRRIVAFLDAHCPGIEAIILTLPALEALQIDVHITRATAGMRRFLEQQSAVEVWMEHRELLEQSDAASLIVHHGAQDVAQRAICAGRPQFILPWTREQEIFSYMIDWMKVKKTQLPTDPIDQISLGMRNALKDSSLSVAAQHHARQLAKAGIPDALPGIVERIEGLRRDDM